MGWLKADRIRARKPAEREKHYEFLASWVVGDSSRRLRKLPVCHRPPQSVPNSSCWSGILASSFIAEAVGTGRWSDVPARVVSTYTILAWKLDMFDMPPRRQLKPNLHGV